MSCRPNIIVIVSDQRDQIHLDATETHLHIPLIWTRWRRAGRIFLRPSPRFLYAPPRAPACGAGFTRTDMALLITDTA